VKSVAFVPSAPFLLLGAGPPDLRAAIEGALAVLTGEVVVVGAAATPGWLEGEPDLSPYGVLVPQPPDPLPLSLSVGRTLLGDRPHRLWGVPSGDLPGADSLLVVGDGTARRTEKAPGHFDPRAEAFDAAVAAALTAGDPAGLAGLDETLAVELWATGVHAWQWVSQRVPGPWRGDLLYADAPYGVGYFVAGWQRP
jgi:hypothetical protein